MDFLLSLSILFAFSLLSTIVKAGYPSKGCFWTSDCYNDLFGYCPSGSAYVEKSDDCHGICPPPKYPACPFFYSHFKCCNKVQPTLGLACLLCGNKLELENAWACCSDCSTPTITNNDNIEGYCATGAQLFATLKPTVRYSWVAKEWGECSAPCGGGTRARNVECYAYFDSWKLIGTPVSPDKCSSLLPVVETEVCNLQPCESITARVHFLSIWKIALFVIVGLFFIGVLTFGAYIYYQRKPESGSVYVVLNGAS